MEMHDRLPACGAIVDADVVTVGLVFLSMPVLARSNNSMIALRSSSVASKNEATLRRGIISEWSGLTGNPSRTNTASECASMMRSALIPQKTSVRLMWFQFTS